MGKEIRTRTFHRNVKTMDRAAIAAQHMKHASVQIKERAEQTQEQKEHSPVEYAQNSLGYAEPLQVCLRQTCGRQGKNKRAENAERVSRGAAAQVKNQGGKAVRCVKEKQRLKREEKQIRTELREGRIQGQGERPSFSPEGGEKDYQPKEQMIKTAQSQAARKRAAGNSKNRLQQSTGQTIRTVERGEKDIKITRQTVQAKKFTGKVLLNERAIAEEAEYLIKEYRVKCSGKNQEIGMLSGGNIQKVVVAREFSQDPKVILVDQPSRGIDIGAATFIREKLVQLRDEGKAIILNSADLNEVLGLSDSLAVFYNGKIAAYFEDTSLLTEEELGLYMLGVKKMDTAEIERRMYA